MPKPKNFHKELRIPVDEMLYSKLKAHATRHNKSMAEIVRQLCETGLSDESAVDSLDIVNMAIRKAIRAELKPLEERITALTLKIK